MIRKNTVLILGAGASIPYGFPTTEELRLDILRLAEYISPRDSSELEVELNDVIRFRDAFRYSGTYSIDEFLGKRKEFTQIGKLLIAKSLLGKEDNKNLFGLESSKDWYKYLVQSLTENVSFKDISSHNKSTIITFNYDRSLEQYLFLSFKNQFGASEDEIAHQIEKLDIVHLHGQMGPLPWQEQLNVKDAVEFGKGVSSDRIKKAANAIKIIYEGNTSSDDFEKAISSIEYAEIVLFLGFGYHQLNLKRLHLSGKKGGRFIAGTALGLGNVQIANAIDNSNQTLIKGNLYKDYDIIKFFNEVIGLK